MPYVLTLSRKPVKLLDLCHKLVFAGKHTSHAKTTIAGHKYTEAWLGYWASNHTGNSYSRTNCSKLLITSSTSLYKTENENTRTHTGIQRHMFKGKQAYLNRTIPIHADSSTKDSVRLYIFSFDNSQMKLAANHFSCNIRTECVNISR